jgi:hypothetical protein
MSTSMCIACYVAVTLNWDEMEDPEAYGWSRGQARIETLLLRCGR